MSRGAISRGDPRRDHEEPRRACRPLAPSSLPLPSKSPLRLHLLDSRVAERIRCKRIRRRLYYYLGPADYRTRVVTSSSSSSSSPDRREFASSDSIAIFVGTVRTTARCGALRYVTCSVSLIAVTRHIRDAGITLGGCIPLYRRAGISNNACTLPIVDPRGLCNS